MAERITVTLHQLVGALDTYADDLLTVRHGVSFSQFEFVAAVAEQAPIDITGLARCLGVSKAAVSKRVPGLVADGWIATAADPGNARRVMLALTPAGAALVQVAGGELDAEFTALFTDARLAEQQIDLALLNRQLTTITALVEEKTTP